MNESSIPRNVTSIAGSSGALRLRSASMYFAAAVAIGELIVMDPTQAAPDLTVAQSMGMCAKKSTTAGDEIVLGVADVAIPAASWATFVNGGRVLVLCTSGQVASAGLSLFASTTAGSASTATSAQVNNFGVSLEARSATTTGYAACFLTRCR